MRNIGISCLLLLILFIATACSNDDDKAAPLNESNEQQAIEKTGNSEKPPVLTVKIGDQQINRSPGNYNWCYTESPGEETCTETESLPPNELADTENGDLEAEANAQVQLNFKEQPVSYLVRVWDTENKLIASGDEIDLSQNTGVVIYEIRASWAQGEAGYFFSLNIRD